MDLPDEYVVHQIASRAVSLRFCLELWAQDKRNEDLHSSLKAYSVENLDAMARDKKRSFKIVVETFCKHFSQREKINKIEVSRHFSIIYFSINSKIAIKYKILLKI